MKLGKEILNICSRIDCDISISILWINKVVHDLFYKSSILSKCVCFDAFSIYSVALLTIPSINYWFLSVRFSFFFFTESSESKSWSSQLSKISYYEESLSEFSSLFSSDID